MYDGSSAFDVDGNTITRIAAATARGDFGPALQITSLQPDASASFSGNLIDGTGASFSQASDGYDLWMIPATASSRSAAGA